MFGSDVMVNLSPEEISLIERAAITYKNNLIDVFKKIKGTRLLETVDLLKDKPEECSNPGYLRAMDIHPSLLQGLIPVSSPASIGIKNEMVAPVSVKIDLPEELKEEPISSYPLIYLCISEAKRLGWTYIYMIWDNNFADLRTVGVRGC